MSRLLYTISIYLLAGIYRIASLFNPKASQFVSGRKQLFLKLNQVFSGEHERWVWVHCASLGEFEQGRPVMESLKKNFPDVKITDFRLRRKNMLRHPFICARHWPS